MITINTDKRTYGIDSNLFGNHMSYFNESEDLRKREDYIKNIKEFNSGFLRFPGGEESDNYLWKTGEIYRPDWFHKRSSPGDLHTDEYLEICKKTKAKPYIVLNYDYAHDTNSESERKRRLFDYNLEWIEYIKNKGFNDFFLEFGNEVVYAGEKFPEGIKVQQYAKDYLIMHGLIKKIAPDCRFGANMYAYYDGEPWSDSSKTWAETFFDIVGDKCDFITPHLYYGQVIRGQLAKQRYNLDKAVKDYKYKIVKKTGKDIPIVVSEWNLWIRNDVVPLGNFKHGLVLADGLFGLAKGGVMGACLWPLHWYIPREDTSCTFKEIEYGLLRTDDNSFTIPGRVYAQLSKEMQGFDVLASDEKNKDPSISWIALRSKQDEKDFVKILIAGFSNKKTQEARFYLKDFKIRKLVSKFATGGMNNDVLNWKKDYSKESLRLEDGCIIADLEPNSLTVIECYN